MIEIEGPDGVIYEFPAGTDDATVRTAMQGVYGAPQQAAPEQPAPAQEQPGQPQIVGGVIVPPAIEDQGAPTRQNDFWSRMDRGASDAIRTVNEPLNAFNRAFTNLYTLGGLDEIEGAADAAMTGQSFGDARKAARQRLDDQSSEFPAMTTAAGLAGAVASPAAQLAMRYFPAGGSLKSQVASGGVAGALLGGTQGYLEGEGGANNRFSQGVQQAIAGGAMGAATPLLASAVGSTYRGAQNMMSRRRGNSEIAELLGTSRRAGGLVSDVVGMDDPARMQAALRASGPDAMLADAGPTAQGALDAVIQSPGEGARTALGRIDDRAFSAGQRLTSQLDTTLGVPQGIEAAQAGIRQGTAGARNAAYNAAYAQPIDYASEAGMRLEGMLPRVPGDAVRRANELMQIEGVQSGQILAQIADDGTASFTRLPDVRQWDYMTRAMNDVADAANGMGKMGGTTDKGRVIQGLSRDIRRTVGEAAPAYGDALAAGSDTIRRVQAVDIGAEMLRPGVTRERLAASLQGMDPGELSAVRQGLRQQIDDVTANVRAVASDPNIDAREVYKAYTEMSSRSAQEKMEMLLGDQWPALQGELDNAGRALGLRARVATNSRTFGRQQFGQMIDDSVQPGRIASGEAFGLKTPKVMWQNLTGSTPAGVQKASASVRNELADLLTRPNAQSTLEGIEAIRQANRPNADAGKGLRDIIAALLLPTAPTSDSELRKLLTQR